MVAFIFDPNQADDSGLFRDDLKNLNPVVVHEAVIDQPAEPGIPPRIGFLLDEQLAAAV